MTANVDFEYRDFAFNKRMSSFAIVNRDHVDVKEFLTEAYEYFENEIIDILDIHMMVKVNTCFSATFEKIIPKTDENPTNLEQDEHDTDNDDENESQNVERKEKQTLYIHTKSIVVDVNTNLTDLYLHNVVETILRKIDDSIMVGSGFSLSTINELLVHVNRCDPLRGSSYLPTPKIISEKKAIVNVKNLDNMCFKWAVLSALYPATQNAHRLSHYQQYRDELNFTGIEFPMCISQLGKFEKQNPEISINIYIFDEKSKKIQPLRITGGVRRHHIHLLLLTKQISETDLEVTYKETHYCWIKNLSRLTSAQVSKHNGQIFLCDRCLNHFDRLGKLESHRLNCENQNECAIEMPTDENDKVLFKNFNNQIESPFIIYADVETLLKEPTEKFCKEPTKKGVKSKTTSYQEHEVYSVGYYMKCAFDESKSFYKSNRGPDCVDWFVKELYSQAFICSKMFNENIPMQMTAEDVEKFNNAEICHICSKKFNKELDIIVRDHSHFTGKFRGAAHQVCNLAYSENRVIPVVFHNLTHYDSHFLIKKLATGFDGDVKIIPINSEKYISIIKTVANSSDDFKTMIKYKFIDSFRFMASSLDKLSSLIPSEKKKVMLQKEFHGLSGGQIKLLERKGVFCYDYVDSWEKLDETSLPHKKAFYSKLTNEKVSEENYLFAKKIWEEFNIKTLGEYADLYLKVDVCLLAIVFENFRETCREIYKLDPSNYYTAPGLSFDAMLKFTNVELKLLKDVDMLLFVERGIRGGISQCSRRHALANNKYMTNYNVNEESSYIIYVDCNNLYGHSMMQHLPIQNFKWCDKEFSIDEIMNIADDAEIGYMFEVDLDYPEDLHDLHNDYPFCAENRRVPYTKNEKKLLLTLFEKKNYVIHYRMLKLALEHGLVLKKIHKTLQFEQSAWLKPYIMLNTDMRAKANNEFEKELYKLMNNAIFGKSMENVRSRVDIRLKSKWGGRYGASELVAKPNFKKRTIFDENLVAIEMARTSVLMDKPISIGMAILDVSKVVMYEYYYNFLKLKYGENVCLAYTDTDSFVLHVKTDDFYADMKQNLERYDTSDYPEDNIFQMPRVNKKVPGLFKDELKSEIITGFVGLRSKMYCVKTATEDKMKKAKGVKKYVLKREIKYKDYVRCLKENKILSKRQNSFRSKKHIVYTIQQDKIALSPFDNKRHILPGRVRTLAHGHYKLNQMNH